MTKVNYTVGKSGYYTTCNSLTSVRQMLEQDPTYEVKINYEKVIEPVKIFGFGVRGVSRSAYHE